MITPSSGRQNIISKALVERPLGELQLRIILLPRRCSKKNRKLARKASFLHLVI